MAKEKIEELRTIRLFSKRELELLVFSVYCESVYELDPSCSGVKREKKFSEELWHMLRCKKEGYYSPEQDIEYRLYFPGPKLWLRKRPIIRAETEAEYARLNKILKKYRAVGFAIQRNGGLEEQVLALFENMQDALNELGIPELQGAEIPAYIKRRAFFRKKGSYEEFKREYRRNNLGTLKSDYNSLFKSNKKSLLKMLVLYTKALQEKIEV